MAGDSGEQTRVRRYGLCFRLDPTVVQAGWFAQSAGARRWCFNQAVALIKTNNAQWQAQRAANLDPTERVKPLSAMDLRNALKQDRPEWLGELSVWVLEFAAVDAAAAGQGFLSGRTRFPKFAKKGKTRERWTEWGRPCRLDAGTLRLPKIGEVRIASPDPDQAKLRRLIRRGRARITSVTIARHADGSWWASCKVEHQLPAPQTAAPKGTPVVGLDRGIRTAAVAATADGTAVLVLDSGQYLRKTSRKLARAQRAVSRRTVRGQASSANRRKAVVRVGRLHEKVAQQRKNALHNYSSALVKTHPVLVLETLAIKNLMANARLARSIGDEGWGELGRQLTYKADWAGGRVLHAPRFFPSSKTCSGCGSVKAKLTLSQRSYTCDRLWSQSGSGPERCRDPRRLGRAPTGQLPLR